MNSNKSNQSDLFYERFLNWLLSKSQFRANFPNSALIQAKWREDLDFVFLNESENIYQPYQPTSDMDNLTNLEYRFEELIKNRLKLEIERNPPLFPWETQILEYEDNYLDESPDITVPVAHWFAPQLATLNLAFALPNQVLNHLLETCSEAIQSLQPQGAKLMGAVRELFPEQLQLLNQMTNLILLAPSRSNQTTITGDYHTANTQQRMVMSLLAARDILSYLTLTVSSKQKILEYDWQTTLGIIKLKVEYQTEINAINPQSSLKLKVNLPQAGSLSWRSAEGATTTERTYAGDLSLEWFDCQPEQIYPITLRLAEVSDLPLTFSVVIAK